MFWILAQVNFPSPEYSLAVRTKGNVNAKHKMVVYFSPACPACYKYEYIKSDQWNAILNNYVKTKKLMLVFHPILLQKGESQQKAVLQILFNKGVDVVKHLKVIMEHHKLWVADDNDSINELIDMCKKKYNLNRREIFAQLETDKSDSMCGVKLIAFYAGLTPDEIKAGFANKAILDAINKCVGAPLGFDKKGGLVPIDLERITNLPAFEIYSKGSTQFYPRTLKSEEVGEFIGGK